MDDITLPPEEEQLYESGNDEGVSLPDMDSDVTPEEEDDGFSLDESPEEEEESPEEVEEQPNSGAWSEENSEEEEEYEIEEIDISELFDSVSEGQDMLDSSDDVLDRISEWEVTDKDLESLRNDNKRMREMLTKMEDQLRKMSNEKFDLTVKNAELEAFGWNFTDPKLLIVNKNLEKARANDEKAKDKVVSVLKWYLEELTWEDYEKSKVNKWADILAAAESYNNLTSPQLSAKKWEEENILVM